MLLLGQGQPEAVAEWLATAMAAAQGPQDLAAQALRWAPAPWRLLPCVAAETTKPAEAATEMRWELGEPDPAAALEPVAAVDYHYRLALRAGGGVRLECWRHYGPGIGWQRRCGPMDLNRFLRQRRRPSEA